MKNTRYTKIIYNEGNFYAIYNDYCGFIYVYVSAHYLVCKGSIDSMVPYIVDIFECLEIITEENIEKWGEFIKGRKKLFDKTKNVNSKNPNVGRISVYTLNSIRMNGKLETKNDTITNAIRNMDHYQASNRYTLFKKRGKESSSITSYYIFLANGVKFHGKLFIDMLIKSLEGYNISILDEAFINCLKDMNHTKKFIIGRSYSYPSAIEYYTMVLVILNRRHAKNRISDDLHKYLFDIIMKNHKETVRVIQCIKQQK